MKQLLTVLALAALATACTDIPTQPESATLAVRTLSYTESGNPNGRLRLFWPTADGMCGMWDAQDQLITMNCVNNYTPDASGVYGFTIWADGKVSNETGKAVVYGPTHYPAFLPDLYLAIFGPAGSLRPDGLMPLCDWNLRQYPDAYTTWDLSTVLCTTNWSYTISASGKARMHALFDPAHTYDPYP